MVEPSVAGDLVEGVAGAGLGVGATVDDERQPGLDDGPGTHGAGFQRDVEETVFEAPGSERLGRLGDGNHLGVSGGVAQLLALVVGTGDDAALRRDDDGTDGHLILVGSEVGLFEGHFHVGDVEGVARIAQGQVERRQFQRGLRIYVVASLREAVFGLE